MEILLLFIAAGYLDNFLFGSSKKNKSRKHHCNGRSFRSYADMEDYKNSLGLK